MATNAPKKTSAAKVTIILVVLFAIGLAGFGYFSQTSQLRSTEAAEVEAPKPLDPSDAVFIAKAGDIVLGKESAPVTIVEYSSLSCPHCAHFHNETLPEVKKDLLDTGRAKIAFRHFPLNEPALRAAQVVECVGGERRATLLATLFAKQKDWAFSENFRDDLKRFAAQAGMDSAAYESCLADKESENALLAVRQEAATRVGVNATPSFYVNGHEMEYSGDPKGFTEAVAKAEKQAQPEAK